MAAQNSFGCTSKSSIVLNRSVRIRCTIFLVRGFPFSDFIPLTISRNFLTSSVCAILMAMATSLLFDAVVISVAVRTNCGRMATEGCHFDLHKGKKGERCQELMQFVRALDVEDADVRVL